MERKEQATAGRSISRLVWPLLIDKAKASPLNKQQKAPTSPLAGGHLGWAPRRRGRSLRRPYHRGRACGCEARARGGVAVE